MTLRLLLLLGLLGLLAGPALAQELVFRGGPSVLVNPSRADAEAGSVGGLVQVGGRLWLSEMFQLQGLVGYDHRLTTEAAVYFRPFVRSSKLEPYLFAGYGVQFEEGLERGVVPAGLGVQMAAGPNVGVFAEVAGRWLAQREPAVGASEQNFHVAPTLGVSYRFSRRPEFLARGERADWSPEEEVLYEEELLHAAEAPAGRAEPRAEAPAAEEALVMPVSAWAASAWGMAGAPVEAEHQVRVPDGTFVMGLTDEDPLLLQTAGLRRVTVSTFYIDKHEVTNEAYRSYLGRLDPEERAAMMPDASAWERANSVASFESYFESEAFGKHPVLAVTWHQAQRYCLAHGGRLPTEAEWEYAARAGQAGAIYPWPGFETRGPDGRYLANFAPGRGLYAADGYAFTAPVGSFPPNAWGLYDMSGNAAEWVLDAFVPSYGALGDFNPHFEDEGEPRRVVRGGSWASDDFYIGVGVRDAQPAEEASLYTGFRCAYDVGSYEARGAGLRPAASSPDGADVPGTIIAGEGKER